MASEFHEGQMRSDGHYIFHPIAVMMLCKTMKEKTVALLHDVLEDTSCRVSNLMILFDKEIVEAVVCLTHNHDEPYVDYIKKVKENPLAKAVKIADIEHNVSTLHHIEDPLRYNRLKKKYHEAMAELIL